VRWTKTIAWSGIAIALAVLPRGVPGQDASVKPTPKSATSAAIAERDWWKNAVIYEIYPRSFQDSNGDGIGDLNGITERLDYLKQLGVNAIWLTPVYPSPQVDFGYDISDYKNIDPQYGTLADFDRLVAEARKRQIRVLMDMVINHTSTEHEWFLQSRSSRENPYRDWYIWRDGKGQTATDKGSPPTNWQSDMGHSAWAWDEKTRQWYYHRFYAQQADVNWYNSKVHEAFKDIMIFWLNRGVGGFRFDAISSLFEDPALTDEGIVKGADGNPLINGYGDPQVDGSKTDNLPGLHSVFQEMRAATDKFSTGEFPGTRVLIGETYMPNISEQVKMYGPPGKPEFHLPMYTQLGFVNKLDVVAFRSSLNDAETRLGGRIPLLVFDNHDNPRLDLRYGDGVHDIDIQRVISSVLLASRGPALLYYGDEIGMKTTPPTRKEDVRDSEGLTGWPKEKGRDGERTPMQWDASVNAGFSKGTPWLPVPPSASTINVHAEKNDPSSLFTWYQSLIRLKRTNPALAEGENVMLDSDNNNVLSWMRKVAGAPTVVIATNFTAKPQTVNLAIPGTSGKAETLLKTPGAADPASLEKIELGPFGVYIGEAK
jgi:alpha-glucosidase